MRKNNSIQLYIIPFVSLVFLFSFIATAQPRFWDEIKKFKLQDSLASPPKNATLFVGSSSFRLWKDVQRSFPERTIINRGFGGATLSDVMYYADDIIFPYQPGQIVIYCGENDLTEPNITAVAVFEKFKELFKRIRRQLPDASVVYVSIKPSPRRAHLMPAFEQSNQLIKSFLKSQTNASFADIYRKMLNKKGEPREELFLEDKLHMNADGYAIWQKVLKRYLVNR